MNRSRSAFLLCSLLALGGCGKQPTTTELDRDRQFEKMMTGVTLVGRSSLLNSDKISGEERYLIQGVTKITGDKWLFRSRFQYSGHDIPLPIPVSIQWAGDTPVITLTDASIPGLGSYTARVVLYSGQYAGTWSGKDYGGQLFGKIVRNP